MASKLDAKVLEAMKSNAPLNYEKATEIAERFDLKARSVVASAIRNGIEYTKKAKVNKAGLPVTSKEDLVETIAEKLGVGIEALDGLTKASKTSLEVIASKV